MASGLGALIGEARRGTAMTLVITGEAYRVAGVKSQT
jgi:hypothetical protein